MPSYITDSTLADMCKRAREKAGFSQREAGEIVGVTQNAVSYAEDPKSPGRHALRLSIINALGDTQVSLSGPYYKITKEAKHG